MKKLCLFLFLLCAQVALFSSTLDVYGGVSPYAWQRIVKFYPKDELDSLYAIGCEAGIRFTPGKRFTLSSDILLEEYFFEKQTDETILTVSGRLGYHSRGKAKQGFLMEMGVGCAYCMTSGLALPYLEVPVLLGYYKRLSENAELYFKLRGDGILSFNKDIKYSTLSILVSPVAGYSMRLGGNGK